MTWNALKGCSVLSWRESLGICKIQPGAKVHFEMVSGYHNKAARKCMENLPMSLNRR